ncbi:hypothetical protein HAX54_031302 [Datura stramonium]|uniref:Uncharacterized protein n=1 Tax=Datura stramonium TaxID=4076 RepID=A0ABS8V9S8_DATST|nr:hypothetical protein [Datura stramonium]
METEHFLVQKCRISSESSFFRTLRRKFLGLDRAFSPKGYNFTLINRLYRERLLFLGQGITSELSNQLIALMKVCILKPGIGGLVKLLLGSSGGSKTLQDEFSPEGLCRAAMFALLVKEELECWPEQSLRRRSWLTVAEAIECCRHPWMRQALEEGFLKWHDSGMRSTMNYED